MKLTFILTIRNVPDGHTETTVQVIQQFAKEQGLILDEVLEEKDAKK